MAARSKKTAADLGRRRFGRLALGGAALVPLAKSRSAQADDAVGPSGALFLPPVDAEELTSACAFCIVGCGYRIFRWPVDRASGGPAAEDNALGIDFPTRMPNAPWISPNQHNIVAVDGVPHHVVVLPDWEAEVVNPMGDHNLGGVLARRLYSPDDELKQDRFLRPALRVGEEMVEIDWDDAIEIAARVGRHVIDNHGPLGWGLKTYTYQFYENTYAITKLAFDAVGTPCWAPHDQPRSGSSTPGLSVAGVDAFSAGYEDWREADVVLLSGVAAYEARGVLFSNWILAEPTGEALVDEQGRRVKRLIVVDPRRSVTAEIAEQRGGLHLQVRPGTDTVLNNAIARVILERGWHDAEFIERYVVSAEELEQEREGHDMRTAYGQDFASWREMIEGDDRYTLAEAERITSVPAEKIEQAAAWLAEAGLDSAGEVRRPRASLMLEKGNYWSHNFANSASLVSLGLLVGAGNRPGRVVSRGGGHQRGMMRAASYPSDASPHTLEGRPAGLNLDAWVIEGNLRMAWAIGCTWAGGGTAAAGPLFVRMRQLVRETGPQVDESIARPNGPQGGLDREAVIAALCARADAGGMVLVQQDLYPQSLTDLADLVLPATSWGEGSFTRMQGERRLRHYAQICDAPGQTRDDWSIVASIARRMGYTGFEWGSSNEVFEEASAVSGGTQAYGALVEQAREQGRPAHDVLAEYGTSGLQCPLRLEDGVIQQTPRFHDAEVAEVTAGERGGFKTATGKAIFARGDWDDVVERQDMLAPRDGELWVINRRDSRTWSAMVEDERIAHRRMQMPYNVVELNAQDAAVLGIVSGDRIEVRNSDVVDPDLEPMSSAAGSFEAMAEISERLPAGVSCAYFNFLGDVSQAANNVVSNTTDPINGMYSFKLGRGHIAKLE
ncbi:MAG: arsenate reductase (azurin) large subunit [Myxococcota bacterium]